MEIKNVRHSQHWGGLKIAKFWGGAFLVIGGIGNLLNVGSIFGVIFIIAGAALVRSAWKTPNKNQWND